MSGCDSALDDFSIPTAYAFLPSTRTSVTLKVCYRKDYDSDIHGLEITIAPWYDGADYEVYYHIVSKEDVKAFTLDSDASIVLTNPPRGAW